VKKVTSIFCDKTITTRKKMQLTDLMHTFYCSVDLSLTMLVSFFTLFWKYLNCYIYPHIYIDECIYIYMCMSTYIRMYTYIYSYIYICIRCTYVYIHISTNKSLVYKYLYTFSIYFVVSFSCPSHLYYIRLKPHLGV
jgi:hypothetical protein